jgi:prepilin-type N-terminal cleavage/methylation domain-containing protein
MKKISPSRRGFTLIELIIAITILVIVTGAVIIAANPAAQLAGSRNSERLLNLQTIMLAVRQNVADQGNETFSCSSGALPASAAFMTSVIGAGNYDIAPCLVRTYLDVLPFDPSASSSHYTSPTDYSTGYTIRQNASGSITIAAPYAELGKTVSITR